MPIIGNHEYNDADDSWRYINQTWGTAFAQPKTHQVDEEVWSKTDSALGHFMTKHNLYTQAMHGATPSGTSRWYSVNLGQLHLVGLDLGQGGTGVGPSDEQSNPFWEAMEKEQVAWLEKDLSAVDRSVTPWVMVMSHFPLYHTALETNADTSAAWYTSARAEFAETGHEFE